MVLTRAQRKRDVKDVMIQKLNRRNSRSSSSRSSSSATTPVKNQSSVLQTLGAIGFYTTLGFYLTKDFWIPYAHSHFTLI
tara:strand:+ start:143 stop:382 length:240 start_codon:yes stop_codon:yes gene_type:complete